MSMRFRNKNFNSFYRDNPLAKDYNLLPEEQEVFGFNINNILKKRHMTKVELGRLIGIHSATLGNKINGNSVLRKNEALAIMNVLNVNDEEVYRKTPEYEQINQSENESLFLDILNELNVKTMALKENLIDLANLLCKKEELSVQEIEALTSLVQAITRL